MTNYPDSQRFLVNADWMRLVPPSTCHVTPCVYAMKRGDNVWHARLGNFVSDIKRDGRRLAAAKRHSLNPIVAP